MFEPPFFFELLHSRKHGGVGNRAAFADGVQQLRDSGFPLAPHQFHHFALQRSESVERFGHGRKISLKCFYVASTYVVLS